MMKRRRSVCWLSFGLPWLTQFRQRSGLWCLCYCRHTVTWPSRSGRKPPGTPTRAPLHQPRTLQYWRRWTPHQPRGGAQTKPFVSSAHPSTFASLHATSPSRAQLLAPPTTAAAVAVTVGAVMAVPQRNLMTASPACHAPALQCQATALECRSRRVICWQWPRSSCTGTSGCFQATRASSTPRPASLHMTLGPGLPLLVSLRVMPNTMVVPPIVEWEAVATA
mmetsp:Transcript_10389/g.31298  ORF Transcript_10389/g.31298 Transcript_10389/m.31298 type:complete len:222 (-) Transcript_10389:825-1490(-)